MATFGSSNIRFRVIFGMSAKTATFLDTIGTNYYAIWGVALTNIRAKVTMTSPSGTVFYNDASPVITGAGTPVWTITGIALPTDVDGEVETGTYTFTEQVSVNAGSTYAFTYSKTLTFDYVIPEAILSVSSNSLASTLTSIDETVYNVDHAGTLITPTITRVHTINYPISPSTGLPVHALVTTALATYTISSIYTRTYIITLNSTCSWSLEDWDTTYTDWFVVTDIVLGETHETVVADTCLCDYYNCIVSVNTQLEAAKGVNFKDYEYYLNVQWQLNTYMNMYLWSVNCGEDSTVWCTKIKTLLVSTVPCDCAQDTSIPTLIVPLAGSGGTIVNNSTFKYTFGTGASGLPVTPGDGDVHEFTVTGGVYTKGDIYKYTTAGGWVFQLNTVGATGTGIAGTNGLNGYLLINNDIGDVGTDSGNSPKKLKTYTMPGLTMGADGDIIEIVSVFTFASNANGKTVYQQFGGDTLALYFTDALIGTYNNDVRLTTVINRITSATQLIESRIERKGGYINAPIITTATKNLVNDQDIDTFGMNTVVAGGTNDIVCKSQRVLLGSLLTVVPTVYAGYEKGIGIPVTAYVPYAVVFTTPLPSANYFWSATVVDSTGGTQQVEVTGITAYGFTVTSPVNGTLNWKAEI